MKKKSQKWKKPFTKVKHRFIPVKDLLKKWRAMIDIESDREDPTVLFIGGPDGNYLDQITQSMLSPILKKPHGQLYGEHAHPHLMGGYVPPEEALFPAFIPGINGNRGKSSVAQSLLVDYLRRHPEAGDRLKASMKIKPVDPGIDFFGLVETSPQEADIVVRQFDVSFKPEDIIDKRFLDEMFPSSKHLIDKPKEGTAKGGDLVPIWSRPRVFEVDPTLNIADMYPSSKPTPDQPDESSSDDKSN